MLLAGKGHEKVQVTREGSHPFDDVEVAREALRAAGFECEAACRPGAEAGMKLTSFEDRRVHLRQLGEFSPRDEVAQGYSIDSRTVGPGELFFAVKGERLDGHDFVGAGAGKGRRRGGRAQGSAAPLSRQARLLAVDDTLVALQTLATAVRKLWGKPLIGGDRIGGQDDDERSHRACAQPRVPRAEVRRQLQ